MTDIFYYIGAIFIVSGIIDILKKEAIEYSDTLSQGLEGVSNGDLNSATDSIKKILKNKFDIFIGILNLLWVIIGIVMSDEKLLFVLFFCITAILPFILIQTIKIKRQTCANISTIISICIILLIWYNRFLK